MTKLFCDVIRIDRTVLNENTSLSLVNQSVNVLFLRLFTARWILDKTHHKKQNKQTRQKQQQQTTTTTTSTTTHTHTHTNRQQQKKKQQQNKKTKKANQTKNTEVSKVMTDLELLSFIFGGPK